MLLIRKHHRASADPVAQAAPSDMAPGLAPLEPSMVQLAPTLEETVRGLYAAGHSQRSIPRDLNIGRRKVKLIIR